MSLSKMQSTLASLSKLIYLLLMSFALALSTPITGVEITIFDPGTYFCKNDFRSLIALNISWGVAWGASLVQTWKTVLSGYVLECGVIKNFISAMVALGRVRILKIFCCEILYSLRPGTTESPITKVARFFDEWF